MQDFFIDTDFNLIKQYIETDSSSLEYLYRMLEYRNLREEQAYYAKAAYMYDYHKFDKNIPKEVAKAGELERSYWKERIISLDKQRREKHNIALSSFYNFIELGKQNKLDYIYVGDILTPKEAFKYEKSELRSKITDAMLQLLKSVEDNLQIEFEPIESLHDMKEQINSFNRSYHISKSLTEDESDEKDGGIEFDFKNIIDINNNFNL